MTYAAPILLLRGIPVLIDADLASLYDVPTRALNQAVRRNPDRFPRDFRFQLTSKEKSEVLTKCDHLGNLKFSKTLPYAFTEHEHDPAKALYHPASGLTVTGLPLYLAATRYLLRVVSRNGRRAGDACGLDSFT